MQGSPVPARSLDQRFDALMKANEVRVYRAGLKRRLKAGERDLHDVMADELCATMKIIDAMLALPKVGRVKSRKALGRAGVSPSKTVGGLTDRQRAALLAELPTRPRPLPPALPRERVRELARV